jgi:hypothetical protein
MSTKTPPPALGGAAGNAQKALGGREKQLADQEKKAMGYKKGGLVKKKHKK